MIKILPAPPHQHRYMRLDLAWIELILKVMLGGGAEPTWIQIKTKVRSRELEYLTHLLLIWLVLDGRNTQATEQLFSWVKSYANILSSLGWRKMSIYLLLLFHYKNLERVNIRPTYIFNIVSCVKHLPILFDCLQVSSVPLIPKISLAHMADLQQLLQYTVSRHKIKSISKIQF